LLSIKSTNETTLGRIYIEEGKPQRDEDLLNDAPAADANNSAAGLF
jgi:hypothetical protein